MKILLIIALSALALVVLAVAVVIALVCKLSRELSEEEDGP